MRPQSLVCLLKLSCFVDAWPQDSLLFRCFKLFFLFFFSAIETGVTRLANTEGRPALHRASAGGVIEKKPTGQRERLQVQPFTHNHVTAGLQSETFFHLGSFH